MVVELERSAYEHSPSCAYHPSQFSLSSRNFGRSWALQLAPSRAGVPRVMPSSSRPSVTISGDVARTRRSPILAYRVRSSLNNPSPPRGRPRQPGHSRNSQLGPRLVSASANQDRGEGLSWVTSRRMELYPTSLLPGHPPRGGQGAKVRLARFDSLGGSVVSETNQWISNCRQTTIIEQTKSVKKGRLNAVERKEQRKEQREGRRILTSFLPHLTKPRKSSRYCENMLQTKKQHNEHEVDEGKARVISPIAPNTRIPHRTTLLIQR